mgnify:CR=1 FL=1
MAKAKLKTQKTKKSVRAFINSISSPTRKRDAEYLLKLMKEITGKRPAMWGPASGPSHAKNGGPSIVGFEDHTYRYASGREVDFFVIGFSARKDTSTLYLMSGYDGFEALLKKLGPHKKGAGCLYIKDIEQVHKPTLKKIIEKGYKAVKKGAV